MVDKPAAPPGPLLPGVLLVLSLALLVVGGLVYLVSPHEAAPAGSGLSNDVWNQPDSLTRLGTAYQVGQGRARNYAQALVCLRRAAALHYGPGLQRLGQTYASGWGVPADAAAATAWYHQASDQTVAAASKGDPAAQYRLGWLHANYVPADLPAALDWWHQAAAHGSPAAAFALSYCYSTGLGTPANRQLAQHWHHVADSLDGYHVADTLRTRVGPLPAASAR